MRATNAGHRGSASVNVVHSIASFGPTWPAHPTKSQKVRLRARRRSVSLALVNAGVRMREKSLEKAQQTDGSIIASRQSNDNK